jgi:uncharacterized protein YodC (DUF2158 family)
MFKVGDVVCLKSGGYPMTVSDTYAVGESRVRCTWFANGCVETQSEEFHPNMLRVTDMRMTHPAVQGCF